MKDIIEQIQFILNRLEKLIETKQKIYSIELDNLQNKVNRNTKGHY